MVKWLNGHVGHHLLRAPLQSARRPQIQGRGGVGSSEKFGWTVRAVRKTFMSVFPIEHVGGDAGRHRNELGNVVDEEIHKITCRDLWGTHAL